MCRHFLGPEGWAWVVLGLVALLFVVLELQNVDSDITQGKLVGQGLWYWGSHIPRVVGQCWDLSQFPVDRHG